MRCSPRGMHGMDMHRTGIHRMPLGLCLASAQIPSLRASHKRALGHARGCSNSCSWVIQPWEGMFMFSLSKCQWTPPRPHHTLLGKPQAGHRGALGPLHWPEENSVRKALVGADSKGGVGRLSTLLQSQGAKRDLDSRVACHPEHQGLSSASVCSWRGSCG